MKLAAGQPIRGRKINVAFIGSCTNGRLSDFREVARYLEGQEGVAPRVRALAVPGSMDVARAAEAEGLDKVFRDAGFEWREPGCSMCLAMNPDKLGRRRALCVVVEPQLQGAAGELRPVAPFS